MMSKHYLHDKRARKSVIGRSLYTKQKCQRKPDNKCNNERTNMYLLTPSNFTDLYLFEIRTLCYEVATFIECREWK